MWMWNRCRSYNRGIYLVWGILLLYLPDHLFAEGSFTALELPYHSRSLSLASAGAADWQSEDASQVNPAMLRRKEKGLVLSFASYPSGIYSHFLEKRFAGRRGIQALSLRYMDYGSFPGLDENGVNTGRFSAGDLGISWSSSWKIFRKVDAGFTGSLFYSYLDNVSALLALGTAGAILKLERLGAQLGISVQNVGYTIKSYTQYQEPIPTSVVAGYTKRLVHLPLTLSLDGIWWMYENRHAVRLGGEFALSTHLFLRWGTSSYRFDQKTNFLYADLIAGSSIGLGYLSSQLGVDLGILNLGPGGVVVGVGLSTVASK